MVTVVVIGMVVVVIALVMVFPCIKKNSFCHRLHLVISLLIL